MACFDFLISLTFGTRKKINRLETIDILKKVVIISPNIELQLSINLAALHWISSHEFQPTFDVT